jgi:hypothetical protein
MPKFTPYNAASRLKTAQRSHPERPNRCFSEPVASLHLVTEDGKLSVMSPHDRHPTWLNAASFASGLAPGALARGKEIERK